MLHVVACTFILAASPSAADAPKEKGPPELQGTWTLESTEIKGKPHEPVGQATARLVIEGTKLLYAGEEIADFTADANSTPKIIDLTFRDPKETFEGIYSLDKDTLKICLNIETAGVKERPQNFSTDDKENPRVLVFHREKDATGGATEGLTGFVGLVLAFNDDRKEVTINAIVGKSAAEKAGFKMDDVILQVGDVKAADLATTIDAVRGKKPGTELKFRVRRDDKEQDVPVKVGVMPFQLLAHLEN